jgi:hypothetical protein
MLFGNGSLFQHLRCDFIHRGLFNFAIIDFRRAWWLCRIASSMRVNEGGDVGQNR